MAKSRQQIRHEKRKGTPEKHGGKTVITVIVTVVLIAAVAAIAYFATGGAKTDSAAGSAAEETAAADENVITYSEEEIPKENVKVKFEMENGGSFTAELYPEYAPQTVANFVKLAKEGFYDGLTFHRIVDGFMAQGGDPSGDGTGGSDNCIIGEFSANGFAQNTLSHTRGVISMARSQSNNSASSQFFICYSDDYAQSLDGQYAAFGKVIEGMETVDALCEVERTENSMGEKAIPVEPVVIKSVTVMD